MTRKAKTSKSGRRIWGNTGVRLFDPEGNEYNLVNRWAEKGVLDDLILRQRCDVAVSDHGVPMTWHRGADAQAVWRAQSKTYSEGSGSRALAHAPEHVVTFSGEVWQAQGGGRTVVVLASGD